MTPLKALLQLIQAVHCLELEVARHEYELSGMRLEVSSQRHQLALLENNAKDALEDVAAAARICQIFLNECEAQRAKHGASEALASRAQAELATSHVQLGQSRERELALQVWSKQAVYPFKKPKNNCSASSSIHVVLLTALFPQPPSLSLTRYLNSWLRHSCSIGKNINGWASLCVQGEVQELHARVEQQMGDVARLEERSEQAKVQAEAARHELEHCSAEAQQQLEVFKQRAELAERV